MRITKFGHACVRLEHEGRSVVIDPGMFTDPGALDGADAVLITHEHPDHWTPDLLAATDAPVFTIDAVARQVRDSAPAAAERLTVLKPGDATHAAGLPVRVVGEKHAIIHTDLPHFDNSGYLVDLGGVTVFHPGDALTVPDADVDVLLLPVSAPWLKISEAIDFGRAVGAPRNLAIHDEVYSEAGLSIIDGHLGRLLGEGRDYARIAPGADLD